MACSGEVGGRVWRQRLVVVVTLDAAARDLGRVELGTLGRGTHFLELQADDASALWLMVHSGSRAMGQVIRDHHLPGRA